MPQLWVRLLLIFSVGLSMDQMLWDANISDVHANLSRSAISASGQLSLTHNISCYHRVFAFDIDVNNTISTLTIEGIIKPTEGGVYVHGKVDHRLCL